MIRALWRWLRLYNCRRGLHDAPLPYRDGDKCLRCGAVMRYVLVPGTFHDDLVKLAEHCGAARGGYRGSPLPHGAVVPPAPSPGVCPPPCGGQGGYQPRSATPIDPMTLTPPRGGSAVQPSAVPITNLSFSGRATIHFTPDHPNATLVRVPVAAPDAPPEDRLPRQH